MSLIHRKTLTSKSFLIDSILDKQLKRKDESSDGCGLKLNHDQKGSDYAYNGFMVHSPNILPNTLTKSNKNVEISTKTEKNFKNTDDDEKKFEQTNENQKKMIGKDISNKENPKKSSFEDIIMDNLSIQVDIDDYISRESNGCYGNVGNGCYSDKDQNQRKDPESADCHGDRWSSSDSVKIDSGDDDCELNDVEIEVENELSGGHEKLRNGDSKPTYDELIRSFPVSESESSKLNDFEAVCSLGIIENCKELNEIDDNINVENKLDADSREKSPTDGNIEAKEEKSVDKNEISDLFKKNNLKRKLVDVEKDFKEKLAKKIKSVEKVSKPFEHLINSNHSYLSFFRQNVASPFLSPCVSNLIYYSHFLQHFHKQAPLKSYIEKIFTKKFEDFGTYRLGFTAYKPFFDIKEMKKNKNFSNKLSAKNDSMKIFTKNPSQENATKNDASKKCLETKFETSELNNENGNLKERDSYFLNQKYFKKKLSFAEKDERKNGMSYCKESLIINNNDNSLTSDSRKFTGINSLSNGIFEHEKIQNICLNNELIKKNITSTEETLFNKDYCSFIKKSNDHDSLALKYDRMGNADSIRCRLETKELWNKFYKLGTEMIITKSGR